MVKALGLVLVTVVCSSSLAFAAFRLAPADEAKEAAFCKSLPRMEGVGPNVPINDYCGCWIGNAENEWTQEEYSQWKSAAQRRGAMTPSLSAKVSSAVRECITATTRAE